MQYITKIFFVNFSFKQNISKPEISFVHVVQENHQQKLRETTTPAAWKIFRQRLEARGLDTTLAVKGCADAKSLYHKYSDFRGT
ncbi:MAG: hypothetical protein IKQ96_01860 [Lachnospiraceae bacterium]|nr:hypothetical protein [Lachnospiraceae bacterium]